MHTILLEYDPTGSELLYQKAAKRADTGEWTHGYLYVHIPYTYAPESVWIYYPMRRKTPCFSYGECQPPDFPNQIDSTHNIPVSHQSHE